MLTSGAEQPRRDDGSPAASHSAWNPHPLQGWSPDFVPKLTADAMSTGRVSRIITVPNAEAMKWSRELARREGIFVGISAGGTFAGTLELCRDLKAGSTVLCMLPDTGERYLSTPLFADVPVDMTEEEMEFSRST
jgi:cysteine synthase